MPMIDNLDLLTTEISTASLLPMNPNIANILCVDEGEISGQGVEGNHHEDRNGESSDKWSHGTGARKPAPGSGARSSQQRWTGERDMSAEVSTRPKYDQPLSRSHTCA